jgi:trigger factor
MEFVVENLSDLTGKLPITLPQDTVGPALEMAYAKINKEVKLKGVRRGKIPRSVLEKNFAEQVQAVVGEKLVQESYFDAVEKEKLDPVVHPEITEHKFNEDGTFVFVAMVDIKPVFDMKEYKGLEIEKPVLTVTDEEIDNELKLLQRHQAALQTAEEGHAIAMDDVAVVDLPGIPRRQAHERSAQRKLQRGYRHATSGQDFEEKLLGLKKGDKTLYEITFPPTIPIPCSPARTSNSRSTSRMSRSGSSRSSTMNLPRISSRN